MSTQVQLQTNFGDIVIELNTSSAPVSCENFLQYVDNNFFNNTLFHRVIPGFMIQGGGFDLNFNQKTTNKPIKIEANNGLKNQSGTIAMARTNDPNSATAQFFINLKDNDFLNYQSATPQGWGYAVFGKVIQGMDVVNTIAKQKTGAKSGHQDVPVESVIIQSASRLVKE